LFVKAEASGPCPKTGEAQAVTTVVDDLAATLAATLTPPAGASACARAKLLAAGKRARSIAKAQARHATAPERAKLGAALSVVDEKFAAAFAKAELRGDCAALGDGAAVAAQIDEAAAAVEDGVRGTLRSFAAVQGRLIGASVRGDVLPMEAAYRNTAARHFNFVTTFGETVWANVEPVQGVFNLAPLDEIVEFAAEHAMQVKGITLVWDQFVPDWLGVLDPATFQTAVENHIDTLVGGYAGRIHVWDVVNEAILLGAPGNLRPSPFLDKLGPGYIAQMFHRAHQADPAAVLFYNEFGAADPGPLSDAVYQLVQDLLQQGVPIHGVGLQVHATLLAGFSSRASLEANLQRFASLGLRVQVSEMDAPGGSTQDANAAQRAVYHDAVAACMAVAGCDVAIFGFTDNYAWVGMQPLIFDTQYLPKAAFFGVRDALAGH
jgi:endo-1,4-beta-xylanase